MPVADKIGLMTDADRAAPGARAGRMTDADRAARGMRVRREVLSDEHVDQSRPGLTRQERSIITLTALATLRQEDELALHVRAAVRNGLTEAQIQEVLLQVAVYAGVPAANRAFAIAQRVLAALAAAP